MCSRDCSGVCLPVCGVYVYLVCVCVYVRMCMCMCTGYVCLCMYVCVCVCLCVCFGVSMDCSCWFFFIIYKTIFSLSQVRGHHKFEVITSSRSRTTHNSRCWRNSLRGAPGIAPVAWRRQSTRKADITSGGTGIALAFCLCVVRLHHSRGRRNFFWRVAVNPPARCAIFPWTL